MTRSLRVAAITLLLILSAGANAASETAYLAGGCFWGMEELIRQVKGVNDVEAGYTGGSEGAAVGRLLPASSRGDAEAVKIEFDPKILSYEDLLLFFFRIHDPTTKDRQGNDVGPQYRSAIFYQGDAQRLTAEKVFTRVEKSGAWKKPLTTEITAFTKWRKAEEFHQDYLQKHPGGYTCHSIRKLDF